MFPALGMFPEQIPGTIKDNGMWQWAYEGTCVSERLPLRLFKGAASNGKLEPGHVHVTNIRAATTDNQPKKRRKFLADYVIDMTGTRIQEIKQQTDLYVHSGCVILKAKATEHNEAHASWCE